LLQNNIGYVLAHHITGARAVEIAASVEAALREGGLGAGERLPTVRELATRLRVSPTTVAAAYRTLRLRGLVVAQGRRGSAISHHPPIAQARAAARVSAHASIASEIQSGAITALGALEESTRAVLYGADLCDSELMRLARRGFAADGIAANSLTVVSGALDGIERALGAWLRPGDRVAVEDPGFPSVFHLLSALGLVPVPVDVADAGPVPRRPSARCAPGFKRS
jgi:DNA-binding transcriptional MocR family regulator